MIWEIFLTIAAYLMDLVIVFIGLSGGVSKIIWFSGVLLLNWTMFFMAESLGCGRCLNG